MASWKSVLKNLRQVPDDPEEFRATLVEHIDELRTRIVRILLMIIVGWVIGYYAQPRIYEFLDHIVSTNIRGHRSFTYKEVFTNAVDPFMLKLKLSFMLGLIPAMPFCILQLWGFVRPGLKKKERRPIAMLAPFSVLLFFMGASFCYYILPSALGWFGSYMDEFPGTALYQEPGKMVFFILKMLLAFGLAFQLPLVVYLLGRTGVLTPDTLIQYWRQSAVGIFTLAMIVTPSNDAFSMLMMAVPLCFLFIISVMLVKWTVKQRAEDELDE